jgi:predicted TPR repeat methyltransferase
VMGLYEGYADHFDDHLTKSLKYKTPDLLRAMLLALEPMCGTGSADAHDGSCSSGDGGSGGTRWLRCLDLGCGTGLSGVVLRSLSDFLEGVDLSPAMVEKARERDIYDHLCDGECPDTMPTPVPMLMPMRREDPSYIQVTPFLAGELVATVRERANDGLCYDLLVACDVLVYLGDLGPLFDQATRVVPTGGIFAFTVEEAGGLGGGEGGKSDSGWRITPTGRYIHSQQYLRDVAAASGFRVRRMESSVLRRQKGVDVKGLLVVLEYVS